jgi:hypothetical protein
MLPNEINSRRYQAFCFEQTNSAAEFGASTRFARADPELTPVSGSNRDLYFAGTVGAIARTASMSCFAGAGGMRA